MRHALALKDEAPGHFGLDLRLPIAHQSPGAQVGGRYACEILQPRRTAGQSRALHRRHAERDDAEQRAVRLQGQIDEAFGPQGACDLLVGGRQGLCALEVESGDRLAGQRGLRAQAGWRAQRDLEALQCAGVDAGARGGQDLALRLQQEEGEVLDTEENARGLLHAQQQVDLAVQGREIERQRLQRRHRQGGGLERRLVSVHGRRVGGVRQPKRDAQRNGLLARGLGDVQRQRQCLDAQQGLVAQRVETGDVDPEQALDDLQVDAMGRLRRDADEVGAPEDAPQAIQARDLVDRQVVEQDGIGHQRRQLPLIDKPRADRAVVGVENGVLQLGQPVFAFAAGEDRPVGIAEAAQQQQLSHVVQQAGEVGFLGVVSVGAEFRRDTAGELGQQQGVMPEACQLPRLRSGHALKRRLHEKARRDGAYHSRSQHHQRLLDAAQFGAAPEGGGVGRRQDPGAERRILQHEFRQRVCRCRVAARCIEKTQKDLGHRRHVQRFDGPQDGLGYPPPRSISPKLHRYPDHSAKGHSLWGDRDGGLQT